ncbi:MAG: zinc ribbon domain-containing protein [Acidobacteria bacterium]|nr:MAG: zinc ribbon domain-containing protein [Acidobacteriota bacterium]PYV01872.1 MAG: zinc ribbon domain-containing protein [Acidobacteriota bacterium]PYV34880.1 MAG: zinc ribbon domain-containing protein [Acidobacteriota bacterium]
MPTYEYVCKKCRKRFTLLMTVMEYEKRKTRCPKCSSSQIEQVLQTFVVTSKKS